jgi:hypothetical protein
MTAKALRDGEARDGAVLQLRLTIEAERARMSEQGEVEAAWRS